jgi:ribosomal protein S18 acetylase RimI-like enzyme
MTIIRPMILDDYEGVLALMIAEPTVTVRGADSREAIGRYLARNPGLSLVADSDDRVVGCILGGHDGRRGYLHHLVVDPDHRRSGLGGELVARALAGLVAEGIHKTHIDVFTDNTGAIAFWRQLGWQQRDDIIRFSFNRSPDPNA